MVNANLSPAEREADTNHQYERPIRNGHRCSECPESFNTGSQLRNHFGHKHKVVEVSGSGD